MPLDSVSQAFSTYFFVIFKNVIGWLLILGSPVFGLTIPGPGGIPLFLLGFALVTFPGKRRLTSRVMRGRGLPLEAEIFTFITAFFSIGITITLLWILGDRYDDLFAKVNLNIKGNDAGTVALTVALFGVGVIAMLVTWAVARMALRVFNYILRGIPLLRRRLRPWLKRHGVMFLPARRQRRGTEATDPTNENEIIAFSEQQRTRARETWEWLKPWLRRMVGLGITLWIFAKMIGPLVKNWPAVQNQVDQISMWRFVVATLMFAVFLFAFRAMTWRNVLAAFGHKLPVSAATRIWSTSELARYLPGAIWQVWGRIYLIKPYGVSGSITSTTQILELCMFLMANVLVAVSCLLWHVAKVEPQVRSWLYTAMALVPTLALLLHPKIFYGIANWVLTKLGKPIIVQRLRGRKLIVILGWLIVGLLWQSFAVYLMTAPALGLKIDWWWVVAGAYCLAWCAGFLAFWAPGGIGVRELVFVWAMYVVLPAQVKTQFVGAALPAMLAFLGFLLRLWTIVGEITLTSIAHAADYRGALGHPDAPGRTGQTGGPHFTAPVTGA